MPEEMNPFKGLFPAREEIIVSPNTPNAKYSYDSNESASLAKGTENNIKIIVPINHPIVDTVTERVKA